MLAKDKGAGLVISPMVQNLETGGRWGALPVMLYFVKGKKKNNFWKHSSARKLWGRVREVKGRANCVCTSCKMIFH